VPHLTSVYMHVGVCLLLQYLLQSCSRGGVSGCFMGQRDDGESVELMLILSGNVLVFKAVSASVRTA
jgi:hypothetical protein